MTAQTTAAERVGLSPRRVFRWLATLEAVTWAGLLIGMYFKYVPETTELGVRVFGMAHGLVFIAFVVATVVVAVDGRWSLPRTTLSLLAAIPPFCTLLAEWSAERSGSLNSHWRLRTEQPVGMIERLTAWLVRLPG